MLDHSKSPRKRNSIPGDLGAARIALRGFFQIVRENRPIHVQLVAAVFVIVLVVVRSWVWGPIGLIMLIVMAWGHVLSMHAECKNSVDEDIADLICELRNGHPETHDHRIGRLKDHAAGSVTPVVLFAALVDIIGLIHG